MISGGYAVSFRPSMPVLAAICTHSRAFWGVSMVPSHSSKGSR